MIKDILFKSKVERTILLNSRLYQLKKIGFIKNSNISSFTKNIAFFSGVFINIIRNLVLNLFYFFSLYLVIEVINKKYNSNIFILFYIFLTIFGSLINAKAMKTSNTKYHSIVLLNMDTKSYTLSDVFSNVILSFLFQFVSFIILKSKLEIEVPVIIILTLFMVFTKLIGEVLNILYFKRFKNSFLNNTILYFGLLIFLIASPIILSVFKCYISFNILLYTNLFLMVFSIISVLYLITFKEYKYLYRRLINITKYIDDNSMELYTNNKLYSINDFKDPLDFLNGVFFKRYSSVILSPIYRNTIIISVIISVLIGISLYDLRIGTYISSYILKYFMFSFFLIYLLNKTSFIIKIMFNSCDKCLNSYSFYGDKSISLKLFNNRLKTLLLINLLPVFTFSFLISIFLVLTTNISFISLVLMFVSLNLLSMFFTVHFLSMYYILKPFDGDSKVVDLRYQIINSILVFLLFIIINLNFKFNLIFGFTSCFCLLYILIILIIVRTKKNSLLKSIH